MKSKKDLLLCLELIDIAELLAGVTVADSLSLGHFISYL